MYQIPNLGKHGFVESKSGLQGWQILLFLAAAVAIAAFFFSYLNEEEKKRVEANRLRLAKIESQAPPENPSQLWR